MMAAVANFTVEVGQIIEHFRQSLWQRRAAKHGRASKARDECPQAATMLIVSTSITRPRNRSKNNPNCA
jgi:hypothetical protein